MSTGVNPAEELVGIELPGGWKVVRQLQRSPHATGGTFSVGYEVQDSNGTVAFLKALDYSKAFSAPNPARRLQAMTTAFNFECDILYACTRHGMRRIVRPLADGSVIVPSAPIYPVDYLIFERADYDARSHIEAMRSLDLSWALRSLHHMTTAHRQLHATGIAHRDAKPSNVLVFSDGSSKLGDLGRGFYTGHHDLYENAEVAGDRSYAPPELLYHQISPDWRERCLGCDVYLLGSLIMSYFSSGGMTPQVVAQLDPGHRPIAWQGTYKQVLPYVRDAFNRVLADFAVHAPTVIRSQLVPIVRQLCDPDPTLRGHPRNRIGVQNHYDLQRYEATLDLLARRAELGLI